jgi:hypothetical protein
MAMAVTARMSAVVRCHMRREEVGFWCPSY